MGVRLLAQASQAAQKVIYFVILNEVKNLSLVQMQEKRDSSARSAPRNDKNFSFSASYSACGSLVLARPNTHRLQILCH